MIIRALIFSLFLTTQAEAMTSTSYNGKVNNAVGSLIEFKAKKQGFAANDPRITETVSKSKSQLTGLASNAVATGLVSAAAALTWPEILAAVGIGTAAYLAGSAIQLGVSTAIEWIWPDDETKKNQVLIQGSGLGTFDIKLLPVIPKTWVEVMDKYGGNVNLWFQDNGKARQVKIVQVPCTLTNTFCNGSNPSTANMDYTFSANYAGPYPGTNGYWLNSSRRIFSSGPLIQGGPNVNTVQILYEFRPASGVNLIPPLSSNEYKPIKQAVSELPETLKTEAVSDELLANLVNRVITQTNLSPGAGSNNPLSGNQDGYIPLPPLTPADISEWRTFNPGLVPTVGDFIAPVAPLGTSEVQIPRVASGEDASPNSTTPTQSTSTKVDIDFGNFSAPTLEQTPTAGEIIDPVFNIFPQWASFKLPAHSSECPSAVVNISIYGHQLLNGDILGDMCPRMIQYKDLIRSLEILCCSITCAFIVFKA